MKILLLAIWMLSQPNSDSFALKTGDLIFQESCAGNVGDAIKDVTKSAGEYQFTHVGIVYIDDNDSIFVIEAAHPKVVVTPLHEYLYPADTNGCYPESVVGRLKPDFQESIPKAIQEAFTRIGKDYDYGYDLKNDKYYCSELIYHIFLKANNGTPVFDLNVMTFKSPQTDEYSETWIKYFDDLKIPIPEGDLGINPGAMSRSDIIDLIYSY